MQGVRFAEVAGARVAYEVHGSDDLTIVYSPGMASHLDMTMEQPRYRRLVEGLLRYGRVLRFDRRGTGISDPLPAATSREAWEIWVDDLRAVLDDAGAARVVLVAANDAGAPAALFAATYPDRVRALVLFNTTARFTAAPDYPAGHPPGVVDQVVAAIRDTWGTEASVPLLIPSLAADEAFCRWYARFQRAACAPAAIAESFERILRMDARHVLPMVQCPTLVMHRAGYATVPAGQGRYLAEHVPGASYLEVPGTDAALLAEGRDEMVAAIGAFIGRAPVEPADDRVFATVLFTDIVSSTETAARLGDLAWRRLLDDHDDVARSAVLAYGGRLIKSTGDGILATFDAPSRAIQSAWSLRDRVGSLGLSLRMGLHAGPVVLRHDGDIGGIAVHAAARVMALAGDGEVWASASVSGLVADPGIAFADRGLHTLKGVPGEQQLFEVSRA